MQAAKELSDQWNLTRIGEDPAVDVWMAVTTFLKFSVKVKVMNNVNFPERDLLFYISQVWSISWSGSLHPVFLMEFFIQIVTI